MDLRKEFKNMLKKTDILRTPKHRLSTFGDTKIQYFFLSEIKGFKDRSRLRTGLVIAEKPKILTADFFKQRFEGFGKEGEAFGQWLLENYGTPPKGLEYKFRNECNSVRIEHTSMQSLADGIVKRLQQEELNSSVIMRGCDQSWQMAIMKFIIDECLSSFSANIKDLEDHGFFDSPEQILKKRKKIIEDLFVKSKKDSAYIPLLGQKLNEFGMFKEYEDEFFRFF